MLSDLLNELNALLSKYGFKVISTIDPEQPVRTPEQTPQSEPPKQRPDAGSDVATQPKDYPEEGGQHPEKTPETTRRLNNLKRLINKRILGS